MRKFLLFLCFLLINNIVFGQTKAERAKYFEVQKQQFIDNKNPIFAKLETISNGKTATEIILKTDIERIEQFKVNAVKYYVNSIENIPIKTTLIKWEERKDVDKNCCMSSNPEDCIVWMLIEFPVDVVETVKTYRKNPNYNNKDYEKYYEKNHQKVIDSFQPIYAKIQLENGKTEIVLKTDSIRIKGITTFSEKYILEKEEVINTDTITTQWLKRKPEKPVCCLSANVDDCIVWSLVEVPIYATETIKTYKLKPEPKKVEIVKDKFQFGTPEHEIYKAEERQKAIDKTQPIYAKIQLQTAKGLEEKVILKSDIESIQTLENHSEDYVLYDVEVVTFDVYFEYWVKRTGRDKGVNCCFSSNPDDCIAWCLVEYPKFTTTEIIEVFRPIDVDVTKTATTKITLETDNQSNEIQHKIYPNPFTNYITISSTEVINTILIFDEVGHRVFEMPIQNTEKTIDLTNLQQGVYFVQIFSKENRETLKIIKQ